MACLAIVHGSFAGGRVAKLPMLRSALCRARWSIETCESLALRLPGLVCFLVMHKSVAKLLIVFILFSGVAWAADMDETAVATELQSAIVLGAESPSSNPASHQAPADTPCDHCCHGAGHYVGFPSESHTAFAGSGDAFPLARPVSRNTRVQEPPFHPPKI